MKEFDVTWARVLRVWWLIAWRAGLGGTIIAFALAFLIGELGVRLGLSFERVYLVGTIIAWLAVLAWGLVVVRMALEKKYGEFRLALVSKQ